ncbi:MAG: hypothetical protein ACK46B_04320, partial [Bacteroidota bacterium]
MLKIKVFLALFFAFSSLFYFIENYFLGISGSTKKGAIEKIEIPPTVSLNSTEESLRKSSAKFFEESLVRTRFNGAM